jgi:hypothetical protein
VHVDLRGRKADAGRRVHGLGHVGDELADPVVDLVDGLGDLVQPLVGVMKNIEQSHGVRYSVERRAASAIRPAGAAAGMQ